MKSRCQCYYFGLILVMIIVGCAGDSNKEALNHVIHIDIDSKEVKGARVYWRIESQTQEVNSTVRFLLGYTPYRETRTLYIPGLTLLNASDVSVVIEVKKRGYYNIVERLNMKSVLTDKRIGKIFNLYKKPIVVKKAKAKTTSSVATTNPATKTTVMSNTNEQKSSSTSTLQPYIKEEVKATVNVESKVTTTVKEVQDMFEPNDSLDKAKAISINRNYLAKIGSSSDLDYYVIFLGDRAKYKLIIDQIDASAKYKVEVLTHSRTGESEKCYDLETASTENILKFRLKDISKATGIYCIKVSYVSGALGSYRLTVLLDTEK